jgi:hypothetical protein
MYTHTLTRLVLRGPGSYLDTLVREAIRVARAGARKGICGVGAHDYLLKTAPHRVFLRCDACGHETPGWYLDAMTSESPRNTGAGSVR